MPAKNIHNNLDFWLGYVSWKWQLLRGYSFHHHLLNSSHFLHLLKILNSLAASTSEPPFWIFAGDILRYDRATEKGLKRIRLHLNGTHSSRMELPNGILPNFIVTGKQPLFSTQQMSLDNKLSSKVLELCKIFNLLSIHLHQHMQGKNMLTKSSNLATLLYHFCKVEENSSLSSKEATYQKSCGFQAGLNVLCAFPCPRILLKGFR